MTDDHTCGSRCATASGPLSQTLDELDFEKSAHNACVQGDVARLKYLIGKHSPAIVNERDTHGYTCLHYAARHSHRDICELLIASGCDVNARTQACQSLALHRAAHAGSVEIVQLLLAHRAEPTCRDCDGKTALHKCAEQMAAMCNSKRLKELDKYAAVASALLKASPRALTDDLDNVGKTPLDYCPDMLQYTHIL